MPTIDRMQLLDMLDNRLSISEARDLVFDLGEEWENLGGEASTKRDRLRTLIERYDRRSQADRDRLIASVTRRRPDIFPAETIYGSTPSPAYTHTSMTEDALIEERFEEQLASDGSLELVDVIWTSGAELDIKLRNISDNPAYITKITIRILKSFTATFSVVDPSAKYIMHIDGLGDGQVTSRPIDFAVHPRSVDRFLIGLDTNDTRWIRVTLLYNTRYSVWRDVIIGQHHPGVSAIGVLQQKLQRNSGQLIEQDTRQQKDSLLPLQKVFSRALNEVQNNLADFEAWNPKLQEKPDPFWWRKSFSFEHLEEFLETVELPPDLRSRIVAVRHHIALQEPLLRDGLHSTAGSRSTPEYLRSTFYYIDIYLKQLACYILSEARRQKFTDLTTSFEQNQLLRPLSWFYGAQPDETPTMSAHLAEAQMLPPFQPLPPEPQELAYSGCKLEVLIAQARERLVRDQDTVLAQLQIGEIHLSDLTDEAIHSTPTLTPRIDVHPAPRTQPTLNHPASFPDILLELLTIAGSIASIAALWPNNLILAVSLVTLGGGLILLRHTYMRSSFSTVQWRVLFVAGLLVTFFVISLTRLTSIGLPGALTGVLPSNLSPSLHTQSATPQAGLVQTSGTPDSVLIDKYIDEGAAAAEKGDFDAAITAYTKAIDTQPYSARSYQFRALAYAAKGEYDRSIPDYSRAIQLDPKYAEAYHNRGWAYYNLGQYDMAIMDISEAITLGPPKPAMYFNRGTSYIAVGEMNKAIADYNKVVAIDNGTWRQAAEKRLRELEAR